MKVQVHTRAAFTTQEQVCQQFIKYECYGSVLTFQYERQGWWASRDSSKMLN